MGWSVEQQRGDSGGGLRAENPLEARANEMHADELLAFRLRIADVHDFALRGEVAFITPRSVMGKRDADFEVGANGDVEAC